MVPSDRATQSSALAEWEDYADLSADDIYQRCSMEPTQATSTSSLKQLNDEQVCQPPAQPKAVQVPLAKTKKPKAPAEPKAVQVPLANTKEPRAPAQPKAVQVPLADTKEPIRIEGKIKALSRRPGSYLERGFIEVSESRENLSKLVQHPDWTPKLQRDVFWRNKDCNYWTIVAGDVVTFSVVLHAQGAMLEAKEVKFK